jgi:hypothetical protein
MFLGAEKRGAEHHVSPPNHHNSTTKNPAKNPVEKLKSPCKAAPSTTRQKTGKLNSQILRNYLMRYIHIAQTKGQSLRRSPSTLKLAKLKLRHLKSSCFQSSSQIRLHRTHQNLLPAIDHVAGKLRSLQLTNNNALIRRIRLFDDPQRSRIESPREVHQEPPAKWRKTKVQMIKPRIDQMQRSHRCMPRIRHMPMADPAGPNSMSRP